MIYLKSGKHFSLLENISASGNVNINMYCIKHALIQRTDMHTCLKQVYMNVEMCICARLQKCMYRIFRYFH